MIAEIFQMENFEVLNEMASKANDFLKSENIPERSSLLKYQHQIRQSILKKLEELILASKNSSNQEIVTKLISNILRNIWITSTQEHNSYIKKFEANS